MKEKKFSIEGLAEEISEKYLSLEEYGKRYKTGKSNISQKLRRQSPKFIHQLVKDGIDVDRHRIDISISKPDNSHQKVSQQFNSNKITNETGGRDNGLIESLLEQIKDLRVQRDEYKGKYEMLKAEFNSFGVKHEAAIQREQHRKQKQNNT